MQVDAPGVCWLDASEHHLGPALRTGGALNCSEWNDGRQALRLGHDASLKQAGAQHSLSPVMPGGRSGDCLSRRLRDLKRELIRRYLEGSARKLRNRKFPPDAVSVLGGRPPHAACKDFIMTNDCSIAGIGSSAPSSGKLRQNLTNLSHGGNERSHGHGVRRNRLSRPTHRSASALSRIPRPDRIKASGPGTQAVWS